ncbi:CapA family protein [Haloarchaeobius sp. DFWS5]|uniref:CapA family protein n=1 Tax=Haloarchaeobius sp. DFWS5 TaxID=3446114 RepID=UPI003EBD119B
MTDSLEFTTGSSDWSLFAAGDCCLDPARRSDDDSLLSPALHDRVAGADCAVVNFEAPVRADGTAGIPKSGPPLENDPAAPTRLADAGFDVAALANNHSMDYDWESLRRTMTECEQHGLAVCGAGMNRTRALEPATFEAAGNSVAILNVCEREFGVARADCPGTAWSSHPDARKRVRDAAADFDVVVLVSHGGVEYVPFPSPERRAQLHELAEAGADVVVAHHPHVPQGWEVHDGTPIFHSLGNFAFDKMADDTATSWGLTVELHFDGDELVGADLVPTAMVDSVVHELGVADERDRETHLDYLHDVADRTSTALDAHWQAVAVQTFYRSYSNWLLTGVGHDTAALEAAREQPHDEATQQDLWDASETTRREEMLVLLNVLRYEGHRQVMTDALAVLTGEVADQRSPEIQIAVDGLLEWTRRE